MKVALLSYTFPRGMGYIGNMLPRHLARLGAEVHYLTMDLPHYFQSAAPSTYGSFEGLQVTRPGSVEMLEGYTLHGLGHRMVLGQPQFQGLAAKLSQIQPDVVQSFLAIGWPPLQAAFLKQKFGYGLFTANHTTASVFPLASRTTRSWDAAEVKNFVARFAPGRAISYATESCYAATVDCADVAVRFFGVQPHKVKIAPLGVDTELFHPITQANDAARRERTRREFGFADDEVVFVYTGQFSEGKDPLLLARAIEAMAHQGYRVRGLFVGNGSQRSAIEAIKPCVVRDFVPNYELPRIYQSSEVGVWPTQESTSMLDAAACGLPIVVNDTLRAIERIEGNGLTYRLGALDDLVRVLTTLLDASKRAALGSRGSTRMKESFSWADLARRRLSDFEVYCSRIKSRPTA